MTANSLFHSLRRWLTLGIGVKRWVLVLGAGTILLALGTVHLILVLYSAGIIPESVYGVLFLTFLPVPFRLLLLAVGVLLVIVALVRLGATLVAPFRRPGDSLADSLYDHSRRKSGPTIVAVGGGTGLPGLLRGLKRFTNNITAIVTVADDGGSSGRLREELGLLPPGDFRNNIAALSQDEALMTQVLQYRFGGAVGENGRAALRGHAFGNLLLAALTGVTGSFDEALLAAGRVLALRGRVLPSTLEQVALGAEITVPASREATASPETTASPEAAGSAEPAASEAADGRQIIRVMGESAIPEAGGRIQKVFLEPARVRAYPPAVQAILQAEMVIMGPGSLYTSILPNLLVPEVATALRHTRAVRVYICNIAVQPGETDGYSVADHVDVIARHIGGDCIDLVFANDNTAFAGKVDDQTVPVALTWPPEDAPKTQLVKADLVDEQQPWRHDSAKLARAIRDVLEGKLGDALPLPATKRFRTMRR